MVIAYIFAYLYEISSEISNILLIEKTFKKKKVLNYIRVFNKKKIYIPLTDSSVM